MSLGAIDFGLMVDGAVIIIENAVRRLGEAQAGGQTAVSHPRRLQVVRRSHDGSARCDDLWRNHHRHRVSAHPLALAIEGRLFHPMALTVLFALMGAFVLTLTIVPVLASYFLMDRGEHEQRDVDCPPGTHAVYVPLLARERYEGAGSRCLSLGVARYFRSPVSLFSSGRRFVRSTKETSSRCSGCRVLRSVGTLRRLVQKPQIVCPDQAWLAASAPPKSQPIHGHPNRAMSTSLLHDRSAWRKGMTKGSRRASARLAEEVPRSGDGHLRNPFRCAQNRLLAGCAPDVAAILRTAPTSGDSAKRLPKSSSR